MTYLKLYLLGLKISLLSFGGAYSIWALIDKELVRECPAGQLKKPDAVVICRGEYNAVLAVAEILPGPQINPISMLAHQNRGIAGMLALALALATPGLILIPVVHKSHRWLSRRNFFRFFFSGAILATVAVLISFILKLSAGLMPGLSISTGLVAALILTSFWSSYRFRVHPFVIAVFAATLGYFFL